MSRRDPRSRIARQWGRLAAIGGLAAVPALGLSSMASASPVSHRAGSAAAAAFTPQQVCGSAYGVVGKFGIPGATVYLMYDASNGDNCATTIKTSHIGSRTQTGVFLTTDPHHWQHVDNRPYEYFAGPVRMHAPHTCVYFGGITAFSHGWRSQGPVACG